MKAFLTLTTVKMTLQTDVIDVALETRQLDPGMGEAVGQRTILRRKQDGSWETWGDVADRVALGNSLLSPIENERELEYQLLRKHLRKATMLLSGRSLQHGDASQPHRPMEVFTNCLESLTKILTLENGPTAIGPLVGQTVTVLAGDGEWREAEVSSHGVQRLYELTFGSTNGRSKHKLKVRATRDHRWLLVDGSETNHIETGDVLRTASWTDEEDAEGIRHGLVFGDGSAHKRRKQDGEIVTQGQAVCSMRLCGYKSKYLSYFAGCTITYPVSAEGDPVVYLGRKGYWKSLPFTTDSAYIAGFIKGWWMADGAKHYGAGDFNQAIQISTAREDAVAWLVDYAAYAGFTITGIRRTERRPGDGSFGNGTGKTLFTVNLSRTGMRRLESLEDLGIEEEVFCLEEPVTHSFVLANGLLTGNCSSAATSFLQLLLLLNGSGVGRCYDDDMMLVDWDNSPNIKCVLDEAHKDFDRSAHESLRDARHKYGTGHDIMWYEVTDSREGWAKALEVWENAAFEKIHRDKMLILDFSGVRPKGSPIHGMQGRPASGPVSLMNAFAKAASIKGARMDKWKQALYIDHYFAEVVHVGDVRRAARMATKIWSDKTVLDFITVKRPIEFEGLTGREIQNLRDEYAADGKQLPFGFLWSANNSVAVDEEFWRLLDLKKDDIGYDESEAKHARKVFGLATEASYADQTGEPGFINVHRLTQKDEGWTDLNHGDYVGSTRYQINDDTQILMARLAKRAKRKRYHMIVNPCSEIALSALGGFCVHGDTRIAHRAGSDRIASLTGHTVEAYNGESWSAVTPFKTGENQKLLRVTFSDGSFLDCTPYHEWSIMTRKQSRFKKVRTDGLEPGYILPRFSIPEDIRGVALTNAYSYGVFVGDGYWSGKGAERNPEPLLTLYGKAKVGLPVVGRERIKKFHHTDVPTRHLFMGDLDRDKLFDIKADHLPDWLFQMDLPSTRAFICGWLDTDGTFNSAGGGFQIGVTGWALAHDLQLLARRAGLDGVTCSLSKPAGEVTNLGTRKDDMYIVYIPKRETAKIEGHRVKARHGQGDAPVRWQKVESIEELPGLHDTYCFTEPMRHMGVFNNVLTYQCVIGDCVPYHADTIDEAEEAIRATTRALIRINLLDSVYNKEVKRTNRIGVGLTGVHEFAWKFFGLGFRDLVDESKSRDFWLTLARFHRAVRDEAQKYSTLLGVVMPHTLTTIKPSGSVSKLFGLTEGWHLPAMTQYLRWVQFRKDHELVKQYRKLGYPVRELTQTENTTIVGFPTAPAITQLDMGDKMVTAGDATPEEQYRWLLLGEKFWIRGTDINGEPLEGEFGNQISYTLKYTPDKVDFRHFRDMVRKYQSQVRCCAVMPQVNVVAYEYQPEQPVSRKEFEQIVAKIKPLSAKTVTEDVGFEHLACENGSCPVDFKAQK